MRMSRCRACDTLIEWCVTEAGKKMPVDLEPNPEGNLWKKDAMEEGSLVAVVDLFTPEDKPRFMPHWATCPSAEEFRK
jgi:hypothetical protein